jgi:hypothetical protein
MPVFKAIKNGIVTALRKPRILVNLWIINAVYALLVAAPMAALIQKDLGHSLLGRNLRSFDMIWLGDVIFKFQDAVPALRAWALAAMLLYFILYVFLNGGTIGRLVDREGPTNLQAFFGDCGKYFWRFVRLSLISLAFDILAFGLMMNVVSALMNPALENARTEWTVLLLNNAHTLIALLLLTIVHMIFDYARILVVSEDERRVLRSPGAAFKFLGGRFFRAWALYLLVAAGLLAGTALYFIVAGILPPSGILFLGLGILWAQFYIVFRLWARMVFFAAQAAYFRIGRG